MWYGEHSHYAWVFFSLALVQRVYCSERMDDHRVSECSMFRLNIDMEHGAKVDLSMDLHIDFMHICIERKYKKNNKTIFHIVAKRNFDGSHLRSFLYVCVCMCVSYFAELQYVISFFARAVSAIANVWKQTDKKNCWKCETKSHPLPKQKKYGTTMCIGIFGTGYGQRVDKSIRIVL